MKKDKSLLRRVMFFVIAISLHGMLLAQTKTITGVVKDATGEVIIGASVVVKGKVILNNIIADSAPNVKNQIAILI